MNWLLRAQETGSAFLRPLPGFNSEVPSGPVGTSGPLISLHHTQGTEDPADIQARWRARLFGTSRRLERPRILRRVQAEWPPLAFLLLSDTERLVGVWARWQVPLKGRAPAKGSWRRQALLRLQPRLFLWREEGEGALDPFADTLPAMPLKRK